MLNQAQQWFVTFETAFFEFLLSFILLQSWANIFLKRWRASKGRTIFHSVKVLHSRWTPTYFVLKHLQSLFPWVQPSFLCSRLVFQDLATCKITFLNQGKWLRSVSEDCLMEFSLTKISIRFPTPDPEPYPDTHTHTPLHFSLFWSEWFLL